MTSSGAHPNGNLRSIGYMLLSVLFFSLMDAVLKSLAPHYPPLQVACLRGATALPLVLAWIHWRRGWRSLLGLRWPLHVLRGCLGIAMLALFTRGVAELPLSTAYTIFFIAPLLITALSGPVLKERVPASHWWAIAVGFLGVLVAMRPDARELEAGLFTLGGVAILLAATFYAVSAVAGRLLSRTDSIESLVLIITAFMALGGGVLAAPHWVPMSDSHISLLLGLAVTGFLGQITITEAFRSGQASVVAPFEYTALAWGAGLDWLIWQTLPESHTWFGAAIVIGSGLYLLHRAKNAAPVTAPADHP